jgi:hypothetical protein
MPGWTNIVALLCYRIQFSSTTRLLEWMTLTPKWRTWKELWDKISGKMQKYHWNCYFLRMYMQSTWSSSLTDARKLLPRHTFKRCRKIWMVLHTKIADTDLSKSMWNLVADSLALVWRHNLDKQAPGITWNIPNKAKVDENCRWTNYVSGALLYCGISW